VSTHRVVVRETGDGSYGVWDLEDREWIREGMTEQEANEWVRGIEE